MKKRSYARLGFWLVLFLVFVFANLAHAWTGEEVEQFKKANASYRAGKFQEAVTLYRALSEKYPGNATFQYNLGNASYRAGSRGAAILAYERALLSEPRDSEIRSNLNYVEGLLEYRIADKRNWYLKAAEAALKYFTYAEIWILALGMVLIFMASWTFSLFSRPGIPWGRWRKTLLAFTVVFGVLAGLKQLEARILRDAVVMTEEAVVRYGPSENDQVAFRLGEGLKMAVVDRREDWNRVLLANGESGWVPNDQIAEVLP